MSAYIVDNQTISNIYYAISKFFCDPHYNYAFHGRAKTLDRILTFSHEERDRWLFDLLALNVKSVENRYGKQDQITKEIMQAFEFEENRNICPWQALKSLDCFLYQSCEGDCDQANSYKELRDFSMQVKQQYFNNNCKDYSSAKWG